MTLGVYQSLQHSTQNVRNIPGAAAIDVFGLDGNPEAISADMEATIASVLEPLESTSSREVRSDENQVVVVSFGA